MPQDCARSELRDRLDRAARGRACASGEPSAPVARPVTGAVSRLALCSLAAYPESAILVGHAGAVAGVGGRFEAPVPVTALLALDPHDALELVRRLCSGEGSDHPVGRAEIGRFVAALAELLTRLVEALGGGAAGGNRARPARPPELVEDGLTTWLLATHAPRDAVLLSAEVELLEDERHAPLCSGFYALVERKAAAGLPDLLAG